MPVGKSGCARSRATLVRPPWESTASEALEAQRLPPRQPDRIEARVFGSRLSKVYAECASPTVIEVRGAGWGNCTKARNSLLAKYAALKEADIQPHVPVQHGPTTSLYYRDPDGNMVELQIDNMPPDKATQYLCGEEYSSDPLGPSFDPDAMLAALRADTPESDLTTRSWALKCPQLNVAELLLT